VHNIIDLLVQEHLAMLFLCKNRLFEAIYTGPIRLWALEEAAVATNRVADSVLSSAMEF
jgi:hypothetical protein